MLDVRCPETWQEATGHVTYRWRPLLPETTVAAEIEQRPLEGARKESLFSVEISHTSPRGGTPPGSWARKPQDLPLEEMMLLRSSLFEADCEARRAAPQSLRGGARLATLSLCFTPQRNQSWSGLGGRRSRLLSTVGKKPHKASS